MRASTAILAVLVLFACAAPRIDPTQSRSLPNVIDDDVQSSRWGLDNNNQWAVEPGRPSPVERSGPVLPRY
jgi:hypothetical protein